jgi:hypothetical protein
MKTLTVSLPAALVALTSFWGGVLDAAQASEPHRIAALWMVEGRPLLTLKTMKTPV